MIVRCRNLPHLLPPKTLRGFPGACRAKPKTLRQGGGLRYRWRDANGDILEWDYQHGTRERYDSFGRHLGEFDPNDGRALNQPIKPGG
jgi:hypothetical protein